MIEVGSINTNNSKDNTTEFRIRDKKAIIQHVLPIFDKYPLLTSKQFHYNQFRKAILIAENNNLSLEEKDKQIILIILKINYYNSKRGRPRIVCIPRQPRYALEIVST